MLLVDRAQTLRETDGHPSAPPSPVSLGSLVSILRSRWRTILITTVLALAAAVAFLAWRTPAYTARTQVMIYNSKLSPSREVGLFAEMQLDPTFLETQIQVLRSEKVALNVIKNLELTGRPAATSSGGTEWLSSLMAAEEPVSDDVHLSRVLRSFQNNLAIDRVGLSYVVDIRYKAGDPQLAARVSNDVVRAYLEEQEAVRADAASTASAWMRERIKDLGPRTRVVAEASPPSLPSSLPGPLIFAAGLLGGLVVGCLLALTRWLLDDRVRTPEAAEAATGVECLAALPVHTTDRLRSDVPDVSAWSRVCAAWTENSRHQVRTLGFVAATPDVDAGSGAIAMARYLMSGGKRVLVVDTDWVRRDVSRQICSDDRIAFGDIGSRGGLDAAVRIDPMSGLHALPLSGGAGRSSWAAMTGRPDVDALMTQIATQYDSALFVLPSLGSGGDARAAAELMDGVVLVIDAERSKRDMLGTALAHAGRLREVLIGSLLIHANLRKVGPLSSRARLWRIGDAACRAVPAEAPASDTATGKPEPVRAEPVRAEPVRPAARASERG